ncbi:HD-GYP domain-containing protein [Candidatus Reidiella endopervernicosa]|uniref:Hpt domain-containing protein n=1 Tax=Candidatus Reidiella endopervernicosa TaxID=2738883 RepID=A0A6N0I071_9GAMM|nr:HD domain-containing phosphohydrolase [Candidatus Reidiella endopervernicosa]QKQ28022.1 Hpt domain-containing protein [Candidatus Reidiella endopervernicosa]
MSESSIEVDEETIKDFLGELTDAYDNMSDALVRIDDAPDDRSAIDELFRVVHSIKSNLRMVGLEQLSEIIHMLEDILDAIRHGHLHHVAGFNDLLLLVVAQIRELSAQQLSSPGESAESGQLHTLIHTLTDTDPAHLQQRVIETLQQIDPNGDYEVAESPQPTRSDSTAQSADIAFFFELSQQIESVTPFWPGRSTRLLDLCLSMNEAADNPVDEVQLTAAVYLYDIGMSFLPIEIATKGEPLSDEESAQLKGHSRIGYEWMRRMSGWESAAEMIHHHHERLDGSGYPQQLNGEQICEGAKIIAIADTFVAMISNRCYREHKRPIMRAVLEINSHIGSQFDKQWVAHFNQVVKAKIT